MPRATRVRPSVYLTSDTGDESEPLFRSVSATDKQQQAGYRSTATPIYPRIGVNGVQQSPDATRSGGSSSTGQHRRPPSDVIVSIPNVDGDVLQGDQTSTVLSSEAEGAEWLEDIIGDVYTNDKSALERRARTASRASSIATAHPVTLSWRDLSVFVKQKRSLWHRFKHRNDPQLSLDGRSRQGTKQILHGLTGAVMPGQLVALMGASGAGKSTFLNSLVQRNIRDLIVTGDVFVNGKVIGRDEMTALSAYVQQDDLFIGSLTVREHMIFQAILRLPSRMTYAQKVRRVDRVLFDLGLTKCKDTKIGLPGIIKGISGGEKKRLAFACEVLTNPSLLFCDEPTTGLDSFMAESVVTVLQQLASAGKTIVCTIHQPASEIYAMFDQVIFMAEGRMAFCGSSEEALAFFSSAGYICPTVYNPADYLIEVLAVTATNPVETRARAKQICDKYADSQKYKGMVRLVDKIIRDYEEPKYESFIDDGAGNRFTHFFRRRKSSSDQTLYNASWWLQLVVLIWRAVLHNFRNPNIAQYRLLQRVGFGIFVGLLYLHTVVDQRGIQNINGVLYYMLNSLLYPALFGVLNLLPADFPILCREHHDGMYPVWAYYVGKTLAFLPVFTLDGLILMGISYYMIGLQPAAASFIMMLFIGVLIEQNAVALGSCFSAVSPTFAVALAIAGPVLTLFSMTGGIYANVGNMPAWLGWLQYISVFRYGFEAFAINQWMPVTSLPCEMALDHPNTTASLDFCVQNGEQVLNNLAFPASYAVMWRDCALLSALAFATHTIGYIGLMTRVYRAR